MINTERNQLLVLAMDVVEMAWVLSGSGQLGTVLEQIHGAGVSGLELPSEKLELKCYKLKLCNLFSNTLNRIFFRCRSWIEKHFSRTKLLLS